MLFISGAKFTASSRGMRIIERTGTSLMLESVDMEQRLTQETQKLLEYVKQVSYEQGKYLVSKFKTLQRCYSRLLFRG